MVLDLAHLLGLRVKMCSQENASELSKILKADDDVDDLSASDESEPEEQPCNAPFDPELDVDDDDGEVGAAVPAAGQKAQSSFSLKGGSSGFSSRSHSIFECLDSVAKLASSALGQDNVIDGVFARPLPPAPSRKTSQPPPSSSTPAKKRGVPDYVVHPDRWTHYSLEDVAETSDRGNSRVAHQYLASLQQKKEEPEADSKGDSFCSTQQKIIFSKPSHLAKKLADESSAVRGQEKGMRLSHLEEEEVEYAAGKEKKKTVGGRTDECKEESVRGKDEVKQARAVIGQPEVEEKEKKHVQKERGVDEEEEGEEKKEQANPSFASFRKMNQKNYRKSSRQED